MGLRAVSVLWLPESPDLKVPIGCWSQGRTEAGM